MNTTSRAGYRRASSAAAFLLTLAALTGCSNLTDPPAPTLTAPVLPTEEPRITVAREDVVYRSIEGRDLTARVCYQEDPSEPLPGLVLIHGGGFVAGSPSAMYDLCEQAADRGFVAMAIEYRLLPDYTYPAQVEDADAAVEWLREASQAELYDIDPDRIGVLGSSAGAIVASYMGVVGEGPLTEGTRVGAVVALSPVTDMTDAGLSLGEVPADAAAIMLGYLGCEEPGTAACPNSVPASPITHVSSDDAPTLMLNGESEIVPWQQADALRAALEEVGVPAELIIEPGEFHGQQLLTPDNVTRVFDFLSAELAD